MKVLDCMIGIFAGIGIICICLRIYDVINKCGEYELIWYIGLLAANLLAFSSAIINHFIHEDKQ